MWNELPIKPIGNVNNLPKRKGSDIGDSKLPLRISMSDNVNPVLDWPKLLLVYVTQPLVDCEDNDHNGY